jgi:hypothetical protein
MSFFVAAKALNKAKNLLLDMRKEKDEESSSAKSSNSLLFRAAQTVKTVNKATNVLLDVQKSRANADRLSVALMTKENGFMPQEKANYRAEKELNLSNFKLLLDKFQVT